MLRTCARYIWTAPEVLEARERLYENLRPAMREPHQRVVEHICIAIEQYITAFNLFNAKVYFKE